MAADRDVCPTQKRPAGAQGLLFQIAMNAASQSLGLKSGTFLRKSPFTDAEGGTISKKDKAFALKRGNHRWIVNETRVASEIL
ncbi:hypothetical protein [Ruegeria arenilitoris]|uniref:hypothetical protein n=1 Tax=Ruegeria arenilitoris TaxID=1173585 RepID=UPI00147F3456|nr:hypothetical protein [Ruegeria arenilitoris]